MQNDDAAAYLRKVADGDEAAFSALYVMFEQPIYRFIRLKLNDPSEASDILHEVFLEIWRNAGRYDGRVTVKTWTFGIAYRRAIDLYRKRARMVVTEDFDHVVDEGPSAERSVLAAEHGAYVRACLEKLKPEYRSAVELTFFENMSYREIAEVTGVPEGTAKSRLYYAKKLLRHCLKNHIAPGDL